MAVKKEIFRKNFTNEEKYIYMKFKNEEKYINGESIAKLLQTMLNTAHGSPEFYVAYQKDTNNEPAAKYGGVMSCEIEPFSLRGTLSFKESMEALPKGFCAMVPAILILTFATGLKNMTSLLGTKYYVYDLMSGAAAGFDKFLPAIIFVVACFLAFSTGTSWGTFGILIPIVVSIFPEGSELLIIGMSACLAGAVCGDHCSPISDTTIMSSAGAQCNHLAHVSTQIPYALTVAGISFVMFLISGFVQNIWICFPLGVVLTVAVAFVLKMITKNQKIATNSEIVSTKNKV